MKRVNIRRRMFHRLGTGTAVIRLYEQHARKFGRALRQAHQMYKDGTLIHNGRKPR